MKQPKDISESGGNFYFDPGISATEKTKSAYQAGAIAAILALTARFQEKHRNGTFGNDVAKYILIEIVEVTAQIHEISL